jgi:hypothetical protein
VFFVTFVVTYVFVSFVAKSQTWQHKHPPRGLR